MCVYVVILSVDAIPQIASGNSTFNQISVPIQIRYYLHNIEMSILFSSSLRERALTIEYVLHIVNTRNIPTKCHQEFGALIFHSLRYIFILCLGFTRTHIGANTVSHSFRSVFNRISQADIFVRYEHTFRSTSQQTCFFKLQCQNIFSTCCFSFVPFLIRMLLLLLLLLYSSILFDGISR